MASANRGVTTPATDPRWPPSVTYSGVIDSEYSFKQWYSDWPGINISMWTEIEALRQADDTYVFDSAIDEPSDSIRDGI